MKKSITLLSHILDSNTPSYGNRDHLNIEETSQISKGASANSSRWVFETNHLGTHIDMPKHFFDDGQTLTDFPLDFWISDKVQLIDSPCDGAKLIDIETSIEKIDYSTEVLLIRTGFEIYRGTDKYWNDNPGLSPSFGFWLRENRPNIKIVGFDFISLTSWKYREEGKKAHHAFLNPEGIGNPICIVEDMSLKNSNQQIKELIISPIIVSNSNGSPVTIFST